MDPPSPAYIRKIKPSQAVLNALGLHAGPRHLLQPLLLHLLYFQLPFSVREPFLLLLLLPLATLAANLTLSLCAPGVAALLRGCNQQQHRLVLKNWYQRDQPLTIIRALAGLTNCSPLSSAFIHSAVPVVRHRRSASMLLFTRHLLY